MAAVHHFIVLKITTIAEHVWVDLRVVFGGIYVGSSLEVFTKGLALVAAILFWSIAFCLFAESQGPFLEPIFTNAAQMIFYSLRLCCYPTYAFIHDYSIAVSWIVCAA